MDYTQITADQRVAMLEEIGADSIDALFSVIPERARLGRPLDLPQAASELELQRELCALASKNTGASSASCFIGGGAYDHFIPAFIDQLISRGEFLTGYTPYQAEASQGSLQAFFEFQTQISRLTGLDISNASLYEGATAVAEAVLMALNVTGKRRVLCAGTLHPDYRRVLATYLDDLACELIEVAPGSDGLVSKGAVASAADSDTACLVLGSPNVYGLIEDWEGCFAALKGKSEKGAEPFGVAVFNPISLGLLKTPGACGADVAAGEGQPLGIPLSFGGPYLGLLAAKEKHLRRMPGRLIGETVDAGGRRAYCLTLQTREQHIRGAKATSNICTNQGLLAFRATMYMSAMGPHGLRDVAEQSWHKAHYAAERIGSLKGYSLKFPSGVFFNEFAVVCPRPVREIAESAKRAGVLIGPALDDPRMGSFGSANEMLVAVTEKRSREEIDRLVSVLGSA